MQLLGSDVTLPWCGDTFTASPASERQHLFSMVRKTSSYTMVDKGHSLLELQIRYYEAKFIFFVPFIPIHK